MKKRLLPVFLTLCMILAQTPAAFAANSSAESPSRTGGNSTIQNGNDISTITDGASKGNTAVDSDKPSGDSTVDSSKPSGDPTVDSSKPSGDSTVDSSKPSGDSTADSSKPSGDSTVDSSKPSGDSTGNSGKPSGDSTGNSGKPSGDATVDSSKPSGDSTVDSSKPSGDATVDSGKPSGDTIVPDNNTVQANDLVTPPVAQPNTELPAPVNDIITLTQDITLPSSNPVYTVQADQTLTLDLNGHTLKGRLVCSGKLTVEDRTATGKPDVDLNNKVTYTSGEIIGQGTALMATNGGSITVKSGTVISTNNIGVSATGNTTPKGSPMDSKIIIDGGYIFSQETAAAAFGKGAELTINGGVLVAKDNYVVGGNGTVTEKEDDGGTTININGGTMIGHIQTSGYIACGVYQPQQGTLNISGGQILLADPGVGVLMRAGNASISGGTIQAKGDDKTRGCVGDKKTLIGAYGVVYDCQPKPYPGFQAGDQVIINGTANISGLPSALKILQAEGSTVYKNALLAESGTFSDNVSDYTPTGYACTGSAESGFTIVPSKKIDIGTPQKDLEKKKVSIEVGGTFTGSPENGTTSIGLLTGKGDVADKDMLDCSVAVDHNTLTSLSKNAAVKTVELKTDVATLSIPAKAWAAITNNATKDGKTENVSLQIRADKGSSGTQPSKWNVTAQVGTENVFTKENAGDSKISITVPYTATEGSAVQVYCTDSDNTETVESTYDAVTHELTWQAPHFSTYVAAELPADTVAVMQGDNGEPQVISNWNELSFGGNTKAIITLYKDVQGSLTILANTTVVLDLNGFTLTNTPEHHTITNNGTLTIKDGSKNQSGIIDNVTHAMAALVNNAGGNVTLTSGTLTRSKEASKSTTDSGGNSYYVVDNLGTMQVQGGTIKNTSEFSSLIRNLGTLTVTGGLMENNFNTLKNDDNEDGHTKGTMNVTGGTVISHNHQAIQSWASATISEQAKIQGDVGIWAESKNNKVAASGDITISGGTIRGNVYAAIQKGGFPTNPDKVPTVTISGSTVVDGTVKYATGNDASTENIYGTIEIQGGTIGNVSNTADHGSIVISGGTVTGSTSNESAGTVEISGGTVNGSVTNTGSGSLKVTGGTFATADVSPFIPADHPSILITFDGNGGVCNVKSTVLPLAGGTAQFTSLPTPTRAGSYTFTGWYTAPSGGTKVDEHTQLDANQTIYAHWDYTGSSSGGGGGSSGGGHSSSGDHSYSYGITINVATGGVVTADSSRASKGSTVTVTATPSKDYNLKTLTVTDRNSRKVDVVSKGNGEYTFIMPASDVTINASFTNTNPQPGELTFTDIPSDAYYYNAVLWAVHNGITSGTSATTFSADASCTRAQMVTFLWRAAGSPAATGSNPFTDVQSDAYYYDAVRWAVSQGITSGTTAATFSPDATVTRSQTVTFLYRADGSKATSASNPFTDLDANAYYTDAVLWAVENGITSGTSAATFSPDSDCTRAQIVTFLYRDKA